MDQTNDLDIRGMHCAACATRIEKVVSKMDGVIDVNINLTTEKGRVTYNKNGTSISAIINRINQLGFKAKKSFKDNTHSINEKHREMNILKWKFICSALLTIPLAWSMFAHFNWSSFMYIPALFLHPFFQLILALPIQFVIGFEFYERAWQALKNGSANMDVLVVLSTSAAFFYSHYLTFSFMQHANYSEPVLYFETSAFIITFILLGKLLEAKTKVRTTEAIKKLYQLQTKTATLYIDGKESPSSIERIVPGNIITIKPGERIPIDGQVIQGNSMIDEALLTGESVPVEKALGDLVYAGTINHNGVIQIRVTKRDSETALSQIIRVVEEAQASKAPIQQLADKVTGVFVPIVILIALATFGMWYIFLQPNDFNEALGKVIAVLIIACPCALGLATPTSIMVGSGRAAQLGILFKEGKFLEVLGRCKMVIFDKTGTLTKGLPQVTDIYVEHVNLHTFLEVIGAVESNSEHPIAKAIMKEVKTKIDLLPRANEVFAIPGYGVKASVYGKNVIIANQNYFAKNNYFLPLKVDRIKTKLEKEGKTVMIVFMDNRFSGIIAVADELKSSSERAISHLKQMGLDVVMLTGDNKISGSAVARKVGINQIYTEVTPQDKSKTVHRLQREENKVIMVGDGVNDAPALASADVGVAMGTGSDIAIESGDVTIIKDNLNRLVDAIVISKKTMINIKQNLLWAFLYNIIMIPFAILGFLAPWLAGAAMAFSSVSVVLNSLRLKKVRI